MNASPNVPSARLATAAPFHLEATVRVLQRRPTNRVEVWDADRYLRAVRVGSEFFVVEVKNRGTVDAPDVHCRVLHGAPTREVIPIVRRVLGLDVDPLPLQRLGESARALRPIAHALRGMRPPRFSNLMETFINVIPFQQLSLDAGLTIVGRLVERFGQHLDIGERRFHLSPTARAIANVRLDALKRCGLSTSKARSLRSIARAIDSGELAEERISAMSTDDALGMLTSIPGIGPWSAALVLLRGFRRLDVFPPGDVGVARGLSRIFPRASAARVIERFGDLRGYLYFYSLGSSLLEKRLIHAAADLT